MALPSSIAKPRGKHFGKNFETLVKSSSGSGGDDNASNIANDGSGCGGVNQPIRKEEEGEEQNKSKVKKINPRKALLFERQAKLFQELDQAESLVLELISLASSTARCLSKGAGGSSEDDLTLLSSEISVNGKNYMEKVNRIHSLLSPHAKTVVAYRNRMERNNHRVPPMISSSSSSVKKEETGLVSNVVATNKVETTEDTTPPQEDSSGTKYCNMYAARIELRLALERKEIMAEMLRLEKENSYSEVEVNENEDSTPSFSDLRKRKREACE